MTTTGGRDDVVARLSAEVTSLGSRLQEIGATLATLPATGVGPLAEPSRRRVTPTAWEDPIAQGPDGGATPTPTGSTGPGWGAPTPRESWWQREGAASRVVALAGSAVTLLGVVLLLVLAAQGGWFGPVPRVVGGAALALGLVGVSLRVRRRENGLNGAVALAGTGGAGLYLDVVAATAYHHWLPAPVGLGLAAAVAAAGLALAHRGGSQVLAVLVVAGAALLAPVLAAAGGLVLVGLLLALQVGSALADQLAGRDRSWPVLTVVRTVPPVLAALGAVAAADTGGRLLVVVLTCLLVTATVLGLALVDLRTRADDPVAPGALVLAIGPSLVAAGLLERWPAVAVTGGLAAVLVVLVVTGGWLAGRARGTLVALTAVALFQATATAASADSLAAVLLAEALLFTTLAHHVRSRAVLLTAAVYATIGALALGVRLPVGALVAAGPALAAATPATTLASVLLVAAVVALAAEARWSRVVDRQQSLWWVGAAVALHGTTAALVAGSVLAFGRPGFVLGHGAATVVWAATGLVLLARGLARQGADSGQVRAAGLLLVAAAVAKLLLFDLAALSGLARVAAFLVTGLLLLWRGALARGEHEVAEDAAATGQPVA